MQGGLSLAHYPELDTRTYACEKHLHRCLRLIPVEPGVNGTRYIVKHLGTDGVHGGTNPSNQDWRRTCCIMNRIKTSDQAKRAANAMYSDAHAVAEHLESALRYLADWEATGYPSKTPGADISAGGGIELDEDGVAVTYTATERAALHPDDWNGRRLHVLQLVADIEPRLKVLARLVRDAAVAVGGGSVPDRPIWCTTHATAGLQEPRESDGHTQCRWCRRFKAEHGVAPSADLLRLKASRTRLSESDVRRVMPELFAVKAGR